MTRLSPFQRVLNFCGSDFMPMSGTAFFSPTSRLSLPSTLHFEGEAEASGGARQKAKSGEGGFDK